VYWPRDRLAPHLAKFRFQKRGASFHAYRKGSDFPRNRVLAPACGATIIAMHRPHRGGMNQPAPEIRKPVGARAALALKRIGIDNVWLLEGGLKAWREQGFPVSRSLEVPETVAERLGVKLPAL